MLKGVYTMASYHCSVKVLSRSSGRSSVQFSAYISGEKMKDERLGQTFNHTSKEEVCYTEFSFADRVPEELKNQSAFWNAVEENEKNENSQVCRTWEIALPKELTIEQNISWIQDYVKDLIDKDGMPAVQWAIHDKEGNPHAHLMAPTRDITPEGKWDNKEVKGYLFRDLNGNEQAMTLAESKELNIKNPEQKWERVPLLDQEGNQVTDKQNRKQWKRASIQKNKWNSKELVKDWRERAARYQNRALEIAGRSERVDHRSYKDQGLELIPTIHEGYEARQMGEKSERVQLNNQIRELNNEYIQNITLMQALQNAFNEFVSELERNINNVRKQIRDRISRIVGNNDRGTDEYLAYGNREDAVRTYLSSQRVDVTEQMVKIKESANGRTNREAERERLRAEREQKAERERQRYASRRKSKDRDFER